VGATLDTGRRLLHIRSRQIVTANRSGATQQQGFHPQAAVHTCQVLVQSSAPQTVNPCKGGRANLETCKKTHKTENSSENNRGEQGNNREIRVDQPLRSARPLACSLSWAHACTTRADRLIALILLKMHAFFFCREAFFTKKKLGAVTHPSFLHKLLSLGFSTRLTLQNQTKFLE
jgi:hypothetical protein